MATKKKNPFEDKPFTSGGTPTPETNVSGTTKGVTLPGFNPLMPGQTPTLGQSKADVSPATTKDTTGDTNPRIIRDASGKSIGVQIPGEKEITGLKTKEISELIAGYYNSFSRQEALKAKTAGTPEKDLQAQELISQIGDVTPEQQALIAQNIAQPTARAGFGDVLRTSGERAAVGAATGAISGAGIGSIVPGAGTIAGAGIGALSVGVPAALSVLFTEYKKADKANFDTASSNYDTARNNMNQAIDQVNKGLGYQSDLQALKKYNEAIAQIDLAESQLKELARDKNRYKTEIRGKLTEIQDFRQYDRQQLDFYMAGGIQKPSASYINTGMTTTI